MGQRTGDPLRAHGGTSAAVSPRPRPGSRHIRAMPHCWSCWGASASQQQLWGKAQSYLDAALSIEDSCDTRLVLAGLAERLERQDEANRHYRAAAQLSVAR